MKKYIIFPLLCTVAFFIAAKPGNSNSISQVKGDFFLSTIVERPECDGDPPIDFTVKSYSVSTANSTAGSQVSVGEEIDPYNNTYRDSHKKSVATSGNTTAKGTVETHADIPVSVERTVTADTYTPVYIPCRDWDVTSSISTSVFAPDYSSGRNDIYSSFDISGTSTEPVKFNPLTVQLNSILLSDSDYYSSNRPFIRFYASINGMSATLPGFEKQPGGSLSETGRGVLFDYIFTIPFKIGDPIDISFSSDISGAESQISSSDFSFDPINKEYRLDSSEFYIWSFDLEPLENGTAKMYFQVISQKFGLPAYTLTVNRAGNEKGTVRSTSAGINCGVDCTENYYKGTKVRLSATPDAGSIFTGWSGAGCNGRDDCVVTMDSDKTVTATFNLPLLTVDKAGTGEGIVTSTPAGIACGTDCTEEYEAGTKVTLTAAPYAGFVFSDWSGDCSGTNQQTTVTIDADKNCTATFSIPNPAGFYYEAAVQPDDPIWWQGENLHENPQVGDNPYWISGTFGWGRDFWLSRVSGFPIFEPEDHWYYMDVTIEDNVPDMFGYETDVANINVLFGLSEWDPIGYLDLELIYDDDTWSSSSLPLYLSMEGLLAGQITIGTLDNLNYIQADITNLKTIPEPATIVLLGSGILLLAGLRKPRRTAK